jgi:membrane associated rhomboid family serine protease
MEPVPYVTWLLIAANFLTSYRGLKENSFLRKYMFWVDKILIEKDYKRLITSGFLHVSWNHLLFNMITLYFFGKELELSLGPAYFLLLYFASLVGGDLFALFIHRQHGDYSSVGASGAISGLVFAFIALYPGSELGFFFLPVQIPAWAYGLLYTVGTIYGIKSQTSNIGHEAHLGGGLTGLVIALLLFPHILLINYVAILCIVIPSVILLVVLLGRPTLLFLNDTVTRARQRYNIDHRYNLERQARERELNRLLEKISKQGYTSLSPEEKLQLQRLSQK